MAWISYSKEQDKIYNLQIYIERVQIKIVKRNKECVLLRNIYMSNPILKLGQYF